MANLSRELNNATGANGLDQGGLWKEVTDGSRFPFSIPTIYTIHGRTGPQANHWGNSDNIWTSYHNYMANGNDHPRAFWWCLNDIRLDNNGHSDGSLENWDNKAQRLIQYAGSRSAGSCDTQYFVHPHGDSNNPMEYRQMYLRNYHPTTAFSVTVYAAHSNYWSSGHDGSSLILWQPNANGSYAAVTGGTWTTLANRQGGNSHGYTMSGTFTIQPQTTAVVQMNNTMHYWTNSSQAKKLFANNQFYRLEDTFGANYSGAFWIQPDHRMLFTAATYSQPGENTHNTATDQVYKIWNRAAQLYGNR
jgi:hypothetical protein